MNTRAHLVRVGTVLRASASELRHKILISVVGPALAPGHHAEHTITVMARRQAAALQHANAMKIVSKSRLRS